VSSILAWLPPRLGDVAVQLGLEVGKLLQGSCFADFIPCAELSQIAVVIPSGRINAGVLSYSR